MKKLETELHKFMDVEASQVPKLALKLDRKCWYTYEDTNTLKEHLYNIDELQEKIQEDKKYLSLEEKTFINRIARALNKKDCGYFRFVFNRAHSPF